MMDILDNFVAGSTVDLFCLRFRFSVPLTTSKVDVVIASAEILG